MEKKKNKSTDDNNPILSSGHVSTQQQGSTEPSSNNVNRLNINNIHLSSQQSLSNNIYSFQQQSFFPNLPNYQTYYYPPFQYYNMNMNMIPNPNYICPNVGYSSAQNIRPSFSINNTLKNNIKHIVNQKKPNNEFSSDESDFDKFFKNLNIESDSDSHNDSIKKDITSKKHISYKKISDYMLNKRNLVKYINSYKGSTTLQKLLEKSEDKDELNLVYAKVKPFLGKISNHQFGNYFIQLLLKKINEKQRIEVWYFFVSRNFTDYASNQYATHVIATLITASVSEKEKELIISMLDNHIYFLVFNHNGVLLLSLLLDHIKAPAINQLVDKAIYLIPKLMYNKNSLIFVRKLIESLTSKDKLNAFYIKINPSINKIILDKQGAAIVEHLLTKLHYSIWHAHIISIINEDLKLYLQNKYSLRITMLALSTELVPTEKISDFVNSIDIKLLINVYNDDMRDFLKEVIKYYDSIDKIILLDFIDDQISMNSNVSYR